MQKTHGRVWNWDFAFSFIHPFVFPSNKNLSRAHEMPGTVSARVVQVYHGADRQWGDVWCGFAPSLSHKSSAYYCIAWYQRLNCLRILLHYHGHFVGKTLHLLSWQSFLNFSFLLVFQFSVSKLATGTSPCLYLQHLLLLISAFSPPGFDFHHHSMHS